MDGDKASQVSNCDLASSVVEYFSLARAGDLKTFIGSLEMAVLMVV